jgi:hypothetical protein
MYKDVLQSISGIDVYAIIALIIFILFFAIIVVHLARMDKNYLKKMEQLPLEPENNSQNLKGE